MHILPDNLTGSIFTQSLLPCYVLLVIAIHSWSFGLTKQGIQYVRNLAPFVLLLSIILILTLT